MNISPIDPLKPESQRTWEKITTEHIEEEIVTYIGIGNVEELVVVLNLNSQEPPFISAAPTVTPTDNPTSSPSQTPSTFEIANLVPGTSRRLQVTADFNHVDGEDADTAIIRGTRGALEHDRRRTQDANLNIVFSVDIFIRSSLNEHVVNRYVGGAFDTAEDRQAYLTQLVLADAAFESAQRLNVILPDPPPAPTPAPGRDTKATNGIIGGLAAVGIGGVALLAWFFSGRRRDPENVTKDHPPLEIESFENDGHDFSEIEVDQKAGDVSTLGDPIPQHLPHTAEQPSVADSFSLDYDFQKVYRGSSAPSLADISQGDSNNSNVLSQDDDTLGEQYATSDKFEVEVPPGMLGLVLETSIDGMPEVHAIKPTSSLVSELRIGDRLLSVDGEDVTVMLASDVSRLIASRMDNDVRRLIFSRPPGKYQKSVAPQCSETSPSTE
jgi:hypothetical protein